MEIRVKIRATKTRAYEKLCDQTMILRKFKLTYMPDLYGIFCSHKLLFSAIQKHDLTK